MMEMKMAQDGAAAPVFFDGVARIIEKSRAFVGRTADLAMCAAYFEVGRMIVEEEQGGKARAEYGKGLLAALSEYLNKRVGKGFSETTLRNVRKFYQIYAPSIQQTLSAELNNNSRIPIQQALPAEFKNDNLDSQNGDLALTQRNRILFGRLYPFNLSWSHYQSPFTVLCAD